ncbi:MAG: tetratricopeptide repeat protein [Chitinophagaceae bacterium]
MKIFFFLSIFLSNILFAQDENTLLKQADNLEKQFKENDALDVYKKILIIDSSNIKVLVKCTELSCSIGEKQTDKNNKANYYQSAKSFADKALTASANSADANYAQALVFEKITETEKENKNLAEDISQIYEHAAKALSINSNHAKANYILGKWHFEMLSLNWFKKAALKTLNRHLPETDIDTAIAYMEKCRSIDIYFLPDYLELAKAYQFKNRPAQAIDVLNKMVRLPNRTANDEALKTEGQKLLSTLQ